ncbi:hypothetical protein SAMN05216262_1098 [Colwellia chukchiensis]|uniref:LemA protein n=1 Tax=Colwellia chukchiensis TaxID=641665 RepID=A0A1H7P6K7_9GAMM|nr:hypothetical protein [Colwellia chukchiensis]SEL31084.1 hypothetical protein SAMN05216262_1098 [Colwellia chukchiensis]
MIFVLIVIAIFVAVSIYFFVQAERLQRKLILQQRELKGVKKENSYYIEFMAVIAQRYEDAAKKRFVAMREHSTTPAQELEIMAPLFNNYATIINASIRDKGKVQPSVAQVYEGFQAGSYKTLTNYIARSNDAIIKAWGSNDINGFINLIELLIDTNQPD